MMSLFALVLGLISYQTANAQAVHDDGSFGIRNSQSDSFADFRGTFNITVTYICDSPYQFSKTITTQCYLSSTERLAPGETRYYFGALSSAAYAAAYYDAVYNNFEDAPVSVNVDSIDDFSFDQNDAVQPQAISPLSMDASIDVNTAWTPDFHGSDTTGTNVFSVLGYTGLRTEPWTPTEPGVYFFYVGIKTDPGYTTNTIDPTYGPVQMNIGAYVLTVN